MKTEFPKNLARAIVHWLDYKSLSGFERKLFSEALLIVPVIEFLFGHRYKVDSECDSAALFNFGAPGDFNYDIVAIGETQSPRSILLETKYLKGNDARLYIDLLKLALPTEEQCPKYDWKRMLLVAGESEVLQKSNVIKNLTRDPECMNLLIKHSNGNLVRNEFDLGQVLTTGELKKFRTKVEDRNLCPDSFKIDSVSAKPMDRNDPGREANHNAIIFSISRG